MSEVQEDRQSRRSFQNVEAKDPGYGYVMVTGIFRVFRGKTVTHIDMPMTVRKDGSDADDVIQETVDDLCDMDTHAYTHAQFTDFT